MKKIIIFSSGTGHAAEKLVSLFNEGNRVHTDYVFTDITDEEFGKNFAAENVHKIFFNEEVWLANRADILGLLKDTRIDMIVLDGWIQPVPEEIKELAGFNILELKPSDNAPLAVVRELEKDLVPKKAGPPPTPKPEGPKTADEEWAESLQMNFDPKMGSPLPPPVPEESEVSSENIQPPAEPVYFENNNQLPGQKGNFREPEKMPPNYLIWSILVTIFCCFIPGIVAIVFSSKVNTKYYSGDYEGARRASKNAEIWIIVSFILGVIAATLYVPVMLISN